MYLFIYPASFKIRSKADAEKFLNAHDESGFGHAEQEIHWSDGQLDYWLDPIAKRVLSRHVSQRGNIFSPCFEEPEPVNIIWNTRKYINEQVFT